jgi:uncharacterized protein DUF4440
VNASDRASIDELVERWAHAERGNDAAGLEPLLAADFSAVGPAGFVLDRAGWLGRYRSGDLVNDAFEWETASVQTYDGCAVVVGLQRHDTRYRGQPTLADSGPRSWPCPRMAAGGWLRCTSARSAGGRPGGPTVTRCPTQILQHR